jgi:hypothetical protein
MDTASPGYFSGSLQRTQAIEFPAIAGYRQTTSRTRFRWVKQNKPK